MIRGDAEAEASVLTTDAGLALLAEVAAVPRPGPSDISRWRKSAPAILVNAAIRLVEGRRKGALKFDRAAEMWFDPVGVEQATAEVVARHKAGRFPDGGLVVDLCSGIGGDSIALAGSNDVIAVDLDPGMGRRLLWNAGVHGVEGRLMAVQGRAESFPIPGSAHVHVDPDRRASGGPKTLDLRHYVPDLDAIRDIASGSVGGAVKLGPSSDFGRHFEGFEVELISLGGECKEATAWFGDLADPRVRRRATCLPTGATWTDLDGSSGRRDVGAVARFVFDPDPGLSRSGLLDGFAAAHGLRRIEAGVDLLSGPDRVDSPFLAGFEVLGVFPIDVKVIRREVAARGLGPLEIKTRGLDVRPEAYREAFRPAGSVAATWLLVGGRGAPGRAILAIRSQGG